MCFCRARVETRALRAFNLHNRAGDARQKSNCQFGILAGFCQEARARGTWGRFKQRSAAKKLREDNVIPLSELHMDIHIAQ